MRKIKNGQLYDEMGIFTTKQHYIKAIQLMQKEQFKDAQGEQFIGMPGDWKILDENGYIYFLNNYQFLNRYTSTDNTSFMMLSRKFLYKTNKK